MNENNANIEKQGATAIVEGSTSSIKATAAIVEGSTSSIKATAGIVERPTSIIKRTSSCEKKFFGQCGRLKREGN